MAVAGGISLYELTVFCYTGKRIFTASGKYIKRVSEAHCSRRAVVRLHCTRGSPG